MAVVDLIFSLTGKGIPHDHGYALYGAVARVVPTVHGAKDIGIFPIRGTAGGDRTLALSNHPALRIRLPADKIPALLPLAGKTLELDGHRIRVGVPQVAALVPAPVLACPLVLIKLAKVDEGKITPEAFLAAARKKLTEMNIEAEADIQITRTGARAGEPRRRVIRVKEQTHVGFAMVVQALTAEESIRLQEDGLGGRRLMGCGLFLPERGPEHA